MTTGAYAPTWLPEARGLLHPSDTLLCRATAGNTGIGLALVAAARGYGLVCVLPEKMSVDQRRALAAVGARVVVTPNAAPDDPDHFLAVARRLQAEEGLRAGDGPVVVLLADAWDRYVSKPWMTGGT